jgi:hypothetical protein
MICFDWSKGIANVLVMGFILVDFGGWVKVGYLYYASWIGVTDDDRGETDPVCGSIEYLYFQHQSSGVER